MNKLTAFLRWSAALAVAVAMLTAVSGCCPSASDYVVDPKTGERKEVIKMGLVPSEDAEIVIEEGEKMARLLTEMTGQPFRAYVTPNYNTLISAMRAGDVDFAWLPPLAYVKARMDNTGTLMLKAVRGENPFYYGAIIVRKDSGINTLEDLRGKEIGWGDVLSFSGHIFPKYGLVKAGIYKQGMFAAETNLATHPAVVMSVLNGHVDAGAVWANSTDGTSGAWLLLEKQEDRDAIKPIFFTDPIPGDTFTVRTGFLQEKPELAEKIKNAVMHMHEDPRGAKILMTVYRITRMDPAEDSDYKIVYDAFDLFIEATLKGQN